MPAMHWLGRKWNNSTDDFVVIGVVKGCIFCAFGLIPFIVVISGKGNLCKSKTYPAGLALSSRAVLSLIIGGCIFLFNAFLCFGLAIASNRGLIMEIKKREKIVPVLLGLAFATEAILFGFSLWCFSISNDFDTCKTGSFAKGHSAGLASLLIEIIGVVQFVISVIFCFLCMGPRISTSGGMGKKLRRWNSRMYCITCSCCSKKQEKRESALAAVAATFAVFFEGLDLVFTDFIAGLILMQGYHQRWLEKRAHENANIVIERSTDSIASSNLKIKLSRSMLPLIKELNHFSLFFMAIYGWKLVLWNDPFAGPPKLLGKNTFACCNSGLPNVYGSKQRFGCSCDEQALLKMTGLEEQNVLLVSLSGAIYDPVFFVATDFYEGKKNLVIVIRGSMSISDAVTDIAIAPQIINAGPNGPSGVHYCHGGMKSASDTVMEKLHQAGIIDIITRTDFTGRIYLVGHSLGAGVAIILGIIMRAMFPSIADRVRCIAYSPPGALLSSTLTGYCSQFTNAAFVDYDIVARLSLHSLIRFRESIINILCASKMSKLRVIANIATPQKTTLFCSDEELPAEVAAYRLNIRKLVGIKAADEINFNLYTLAENMNQNIGDSFNEKLSAESDESKMQQEDQKSILKKLKLLKPLRSFITNRTFAKSNTSDKNELISSTEIEVLTATQLFPPSRLLKFELVQNDNFKKEKVYAPSYVSGTSLSNIVCCPRMLKSHFPFSIYHAVNSVEKGINSGNLYTIVEQDVLSADSASDPFFFGSNSIFDNQNKYKVSNGQTINSCLRESCIDLDTGTDPDRQVDNTN